MKRHLLHIVFGAVAAAAALAPGIALASVHHYVCSDFLLAGSASCASDILTLTGAGAEGYDFAQAGGSAAIYPLTSGVTYYLSVTITGGTSAKYRYCCQATPPGFVTFSTNLVANALANPANNQGAGLDFVEVSGNPALSSICLTDVSGSCEAVASFFVYMPGGLLVFGDW